MLVNGLLLAFIVGRFVYLATKPTQSMTGEESRNQKLDNALSPNKLILFRILSMTGPVIALSSCIAYSVDIMRISYWVAFFVIPVSFFWARKMRTKYCSLLNQRYYFFAMWVNGGLIITYCPFLLLAISTFFSV